MDDWKSRLQSDFARALVGIEFRAGHGFSQPGELLVVEAIAVRRRVQECDLEVSVRPYALKEGEAEDCETAPFVHDLRGWARDPDPAVRAGALHDLALIEGPRIPRAAIEGWPVVLAYSANDNHRLFVRRPTNRAGRVVFPRLPARARCGLFLNLVSVAIPASTKLAAAGDQTDWTPRRDTYTSDDPRWSASFRELEDGGTELIVFLTDPSLAERAAQIEIDGQTYPVRFQPTGFGAWSAEVFLDRSFEEPWSRVVSLAFPSFDVESEQSG